MIEKTTDRYSCNVFWSANDDAYIAVCPEFPGLSAFGGTREEALAQLEVALELSIEAYESEGWQLPQPKEQAEFSGQFRVRMPKTLHAKLAQQAQQERVSLNTLVVTLLSEGVGLREGFNHVWKRFAASVGNVAPVPTDHKSHYAFDYRHGSFSKAIGAMRMGAHPGGMSRSHIDIIGAVGPLGGETRTDDVTLSAGVQDDASDTYVSSAESLLNRLWK
jgi:predicted RNase H-like HicB family nuclease